MSELDRILAPVDPPKPRRLTTVQLKCGHTNSFEIPPSNGDIVYCPRHASFFEVVSGGKHKNLRFRCRDCGRTQYSSKNNISLDSLKLRADTHALKHKHTVDVFSGRIRIIATYHPPAIVTQPL